MPELFIQNKTTVIKLMALCILSALVELSVVKAESLIIDYGLLRSNYRNVLCIGLGLLVLLSVELVTNLFRSKYAEQLASDGTNCFYRLLARHALERPLVLAKDSDYLLSRIEEAGNLQPMIGIFTTAFLPCLVTGLVSFVALSNISLLLLIPVCVSALFISLLYPFALSKLSTKSEKALEAQARGSAYLAQPINCRLYIRISRSISLELLRYKKMLKACRNSRVEESVFARLATEIVDAGNIITGLLSVLLLIFLVSKRGLTVGIAVQSYQLVLLCYSPFPLVLNCWAQLQPSFRSLHRVLELRRLLEAEKPNLICFDHADRISWKGIILSFSSNETNERITIPDCTIQAPCLVLVSGPNACGKSSFLEVLNGLLSPVAGRLCVNESTVIFDGSTLIQLPCATMPQRHLIMGGTFRKALYYGLVDIDSEKLIYLLKGFSLDKLFEVNPIIGARGHNLSGGELASLLLCRAFLSSYSIIILDEPCNNLDNASISFLKMVVAQEMKERIVIIADHGHGFEQFADYVIQFQEPEKTI